MFYYLRLEKLLEFWDRMKAGGRKSFRFEELEPEYEIKPKQGILVPYLDYVSMDLSLRDDISDAQRN